MNKQKWKEIFTWTVVFTFILSTFPAPASTANDIADSAYINGNIYTMDTQALITALDGDVVYQKDISKASAIWQGVPISFTTAPMIKDGRIYVEAAALADKLGATVNYKEGSFELTMTKGAKALTLTVVKSGDQEMVPIRDVLEVFEYFRN